MYVMPACHVCMNAMHVLYAMAPSSRRRGAFDHVFHVYLVYGTICARLAPVQTPDL